MIERRDVDPGALPGDEERTMLRDAMRALLDAHWPASDAVARGRDVAACAATWRLLGEQGLLAPGSGPALGGLRELVVAMEELGRAACPLPLHAAALAQLAFASAAFAPSCDGAADEAETAASASTDERAALLARLERGEVRVCWSFGAHDASADVGRIAWQGATVRGTLRLVDGAALATHAIVATTRGARAGLAIVALDGVDSARVTPTRALGTDGLAEIVLADAPAIFVRLPDGALDDLLRVARVAVAARAHGAARRAFELAVAYAKERRQFGQPIGRFQAIQHKLADNLIALEGTRATLAHAAASFDLGDPLWRYFAAAAAAFAGPALRHCALQTQHAFGAIGYAEEHEAPRHFRRVHLDALAFGGAGAAKRELAAHWLDADDAAFPEYDLGAAGNAFRREVRDWLERHWSGARKHAYDGRDFHDREFDADFARALGATGWLGLGWPRAHGGQERSPLEQIAFMEMMERAGAPPRFGASVQANALILHGSKAQQDRYLPEILRGEAMHGMGYSEPNAGSDLAALQTRAVLERDVDGREQWVIHGQKIWTTTYWGRYMFLAARTDRDAKPAHAGISMFIVPMDTPGITVKPAATMYDGSFANIFYDDVRVPADALVGPLHGGWKVLTDALANERGLVGGGIVLKVAHAFELLCAELRSDEHAAAARDPLVRDRIATFAAEIEAGRRLMVHCAEAATAGTTPPELGAISKVFSGELMERFHEAALDLLGPRAALSQGAAGAIANGRFEQGLRHSLMWVISIGTNEIQRSLIAQRGLGLPR